MSLAPIHEGTLKARPIEHSHNGELHGGRLHGGKMQHGRVEHGGKLSRGREVLHGNAEESPQLSARAEINSLVSSLGSLASQAGSLPLTPPTLPGLPQNAGYQPQPTDYSYDQPN